MLRFAGLNEKNIPREAMFWKDFTQACSQAMKWQLFHTNTRQRKSKLLLSQYSFNYELIFGMIRPGVP